MAVLNLKTAPKDSIERIIWLDGVHEAVQKELAAQYEAAYFAARMEGRLDAAIHAGQASRSKALRYTRNRNEKMGRAVRWGDGADPSSTNYEG